jgi:hypothetical protein
MNAQAYFNSKAVSDEPKKIFNLESRNAVEAAQKAQPGWAKKSGRVDN